MDIYMLDVEWDVLYCVVVGQPLLHKTILPRETIKLTLTDSVTCVTSRSL